MEPAWSRHAVKDDPPRSGPLPTSGDGQGGGDLAVSAMQHYLALVDRGLAEDPTVEGSNRSHSGCHGGGSYLKRVPNRQRCSWNRSDVVGYNPPVCPRGRPLSDEGDTRHACISYQGRA